MNPMNFNEIKIVRNVSIDKYWLCFSKAYKFFNVNQISPLVLGAPRISMKAKRITRRSLLQEDRDIVEFILK